MLTITLKTTRFPPNKNMRLNTHKSLISFFQLDVVKWEEVNPSLHKGKP